MLILSRPPRRRRDAAHRTAARANESAEDRADRRKSDTAARAATREAKLAAEIAAVEGVDLDADEFPPEVLAQTTQTMPGAAAQLIASDNGIVMHRLLHNNLDHVDPSEPQHTAIVDRLVTYV